MAEAKGELGPLPRYYTLKQSLSIDYATCEDTVSRSNLGLHALSQPGCTSKGSSAKDHITATDNTIDLSRKR